MFLGQQESLDEESTMRFARSVVLQLATACFRRLDLRHACWPYSLQRLLSHRTSVAEKTALVRDLLKTNRCCLDICTAKFLSLFPDEAALLGPRAGAFLVFMERLLKFSVAPAECEHAAVKGETASKTAATSQAALAHRVVCRHLHRAH